MKNTMKVLSRVVLIVALGILFSFMAKTEVKAYTITYAKGSDILTSSDLVFVSASIEAPSRVVKGQDYRYSPVGKIYLHLSPILSPIMQTAEP